MKLRNDEMQAIIALLNEVPLQDAIPSACDRAELLNKLVVAHKAAHKAALKPEPFVALP